MRRLWAAVAMGMLMMGASLASAAVAPQAAETTITGPLVVLAGATATFEGEHRTRNGGIGIPASRVQLFVDDAPEGVDTAWTGDWAIAHTFPARGVATVRAVAEEDLPQESTSRTLTVRVAVEPTVPIAMDAVAVDGSRSVQVSWAAPSDDGGAPIVGYTVSRRAAGGNWTVLAQLGPNTLAHRDAAVPLGPTYEYGVTASNAVAASAPALSAVRGEPPAPPALTATPRDGTNRVDLVVAAAGGVTQRVEMERSLDGGATWSFLGGADGTSLTGYDMVDVSGTRPLYRATARSVVGDSAPSPAALVGAPPGAPSDVRLVLSTLVRVAWSPPVDGGPVQQYRVLDRGQQVAVTSASARNVTVPYTAGVAHAWSVQALSLVADGPASSTLPASPPAPPSLLGTPRDGSNVVDLLAADAGGVTQSLEVQRSLDGGATWTSLTNGTGTSLSATDSVDFSRPLPSYRALARNLFGASAPTAASLVADAPGVPQDVRAEVTSVLRLAWSAPADGGPVQAYRILDRGTPVAHVVATARNATLATTAGVLHEWSVQAVNVVGASAESDRVSVEPPAAPTLTLSVVSGTSKVRLAASATDALTRTLEVQRSTDNGSTWSAVASGAAPNYTAEVTVDLLTPTRAIFRAVARAPTGDSAPTSPTLVGSRPSAPTGLRFSSGYQIDAQWDAASGAQGYRVLRDGVLVEAHVAASVTRARLAVTPGVPVQVSVQALSYLGDSDPSATLTGKFERPSAPRSLNATTSDAWYSALVNLTWASPSSNGNATVMHYEVWRTPGPSGGAARIGNVSGSATSFTGDRVAGDGTSYKYEVHAVNAMGSSPVATLTIAPDMGWEIQLSALSFQVCETVYPVVGRSYERCGNVTEGGTFQRIDDTETYAYVKVNFTGVLTRHGAAVSNTSVYVQATFPGDTDCEVCSYDSAATNATGVYVTDPLGSWPAWSRSGCTSWTIHAFAMTSAWRSDDIYPSIVVCAA